MTTLTAVMLSDRYPGNQHAANRQISQRHAAKPGGPFQRLRSGLKAGRRVSGDTANRRSTGTLLHDVALGGTAASAATSYLKSLATGRRA